MNMETLLEILKFSVSGGFWHFVGCWIIIGIILYLPTRIITAVFHGANVRKHGWPVQEEIEETEED